MYPFKTDPDKEITLVRKNIGRLKTNRAASLAMVQRHQAAAAAANTAGDDKAGVERNLQAKRSAEENVATDDISIADEETKLASLIAERDMQIDKVARHAAANEIEQMLRESGDLVREGEQFFNRLAAWCERAGPNVPEIMGVEHLAIAMRQQIPEAMTLFQKLLGNLASSVLAGQTSPKLKVKAAVPPPIGAPALPTQTVFTWHAITWRDHGGNQRVLGKWNEASLPVEAAQFALAANIVIPNDDPRIGKLRGQSPGHPEPNWLNDLDTKIGPNIPDSQRIDDPAVAVEPFIRRREPNVPYVIQHKEQAS